jgi:hypothetical protein
MIRREVVVLVPAVNRPKNVEPLSRSLRESGAPSARLLFILDPLDLEQLRAVNDADEDVLFCNELSWPKRINYGYRHTQEPWMLLCADDVRFHPGWWQATEVPRRLGYKVIGTQDLGNPRVIKGQHSTHPLVSRLYADYCGTIDGPGEVVHEGYRHWCVDDELVATAKSRGEWAFAQDAIIEHLHPYWGKSEWDEVYQLGESQAEQDVALWGKRKERIPCSR